MAYQKMTASTLWSFMLPGTSLSMSSHPEVGLALRTSREASGLTQEKLGELSGIHATHIGRIERGESEPTLGTLVDLAVSLELEPDYFVRFRMPVGFRLAIAPPAAGAHSLAVHEAGQRRRLPSPPEFVVVIQRTREGYSAFVPDLPGAPRVAPLSGPRKLPFSRPETITCKGCGGQVARSPPPPLPRCA
jgi:transcriptional regulator with XRE-family HTH domain